MVNDSIFYTRTYDNGIFTIEWLYDNVKNKFIAQLLRFLDGDIYDSINLESLNKSTDFYMKKLNKQCHTNFKKDFNLKNKMHLNYLSNKCSMNITIKINNRTIKIDNSFNRMFYLVINKNKYGLVLKSNKKTMNTALPNSSLPALGNLSSRLKEGGDDGDDGDGDGDGESVVPGSPQRGEEPQSEGAEPQKGLKRERQPNNSNSPAANSPAANSSAAKRLALRRPALRRKLFGQNTILNTILDVSTDKNIRDCLSNCYVNETSTYYTDDILTKMNTEIDKDITAWSKLTTDDNILGFITDDMGKYFDYSIYRDEYNKLTEPKVKSIADYALGRKMETIVGDYTEDEKISLSKRYEDLYNSYEQINSLSSAPSSVDISGFNTAIGNIKILPELKDNVKFNVKILPELEDNVKFNVKMNLLNLSYSSNKGDWDIISQNDEEWIDDEGLKARENWSNERRKGRGEEEGTDDDMEGEGTDDDMEEEGTDDDMEGNLSKRNVPMNGQGAGSLEGGVAPLKFALNLLNQKNNGNDVYKTTIDGYSIIGLLERGIDSQHDFGSGIKDNKKITLNAKKELFRAFNPEKIDEDFTYAVADYKSFIISLAVLVYNSFNEKVIKDIKKSKNYQIKTGLSIPFEPRLTKRAEMDWAHNPFANGGWEKNAKLYYIAGNTLEYKPSVPKMSMSHPNGYTGVNLFDEVKGSNKKIIIFQDSQGSSDAIFSFFNNIDMRPGSFYQSFDNYIRTLKTPVQIATFINKLKSIQAELGFLATSTNFDGDDMKEGLFNILKKKKLQNFNTGFINTGDKSWFMKTPATALDGAGTDYLDIVEFKRNLDEINTMCGLTGNNILSLEKIWNHNGNFDATLLPNLAKFKVDYSGIPVFGGTLPDANLQSLHRLVCMNTTTKKNILDETYQDHFGKICNSNSRVKPVLKGGITNPFGLENVHDIKFEVVLGEYKDVKDGKYEVQLWPVLLMSHYKINPSTSNNIKKTGTKYDMVVRSISIENLTEKNNLSNVLNIAYDNMNKDLNTILNNAVTKTNIDIGYQIIYKNIKEWAKNTSIKIKNKNKNSIWKSSHINLVFIRVLYTLKMIGDHGQVKFIKALKENVTNFNANFEVLFTTGDALASLYACEHRITNMSTIVTDFPSEVYCVSKPKGMVYYPSV
tara:strand:- start:4150 stop:7611 length:3462 start_codon:yes stop_codon:yes gene_type:complete